MSQSPDSTVHVPESILQFLQMFFASPEHGILYIENECKRFCQTYRHLTVAEKVAFLCHIGERYGVNQGNIIQVSQHVIAAQERGEAIMLKAEERLRSTLTAQYQQLFSQIGRIEGGVKFLVDMRADILTLASSSVSEIDSAHFRALQTTLRELLSLWFSVGFLSLERVTWHSPCDMVQKVSDYEAVHPIRNWADLKQRVGPYRRCFVFTHTSMPREPVVVLHTALTDDISSSIHSIIFSHSNTSSSPAPTSPILSSPTETTVDDEPEVASRINTAMFYSITSTQKGLQGVDMGNYLIKKVVGELQQEFPHMTQFSSISPIPGFTDWLLSQVNQELHVQSIGEKDDSKFGILLEEDMSALKEFAETETQSPLETFKELISSHGWTNVGHLAAVIQKPLMRLCAQYLYTEKRRGYALNPVANFHLQNGAVMWRLNWMADLSRRGLLKSCGIMVNYRYFLDDTESNSKQYIEEYVINCSDQIKELCCLQTEGTS